MVQSKENIKSTVKAFQSWTRFFLIIFCLLFFILFLLDSYLFPSLSTTVRNWFLAFIFLFVTSSAVLLFWWTNKLVRKYSSNAIGGIQLKDLARAVDEFALVDYSDKNGLIVDANKLFCENSGYTREEIIGQDHRMLNSGYHSKEFFNNLWATVLSGNIWRGEVLEKSKHGELYWTDTMIVPYVGSDEKSYNFISIRKNITDRVAAEAELKKINRFYRFIIAVNETILKQVDQDSLFTEACNIAIEFGKFRMAWIGQLDPENNSIVPVALAGHSDGYVGTIQASATDTKQGRGPSGKAIRTGIYQYSNNIETDPDMEPWRERALERGYKSSISLPMELTDGTKFIYTLYMTEVDFFNEVEIKLLQDVCTNIQFALEKILLLQKQKQAENELRESEGKFRSLVEQTQWGVYIYQNNHFQYVNPAFEKITGYPKSKVESNFSFEKLVHDEDMELLKESYRASISGNIEEDRFVIRIIRSDGEIRRIQIDATNISLNGSPAVIGTFMDITKAIEEEIRIDKATVEAQENERMQIGMELHDNVKQILAASVLQLDLVEFAKTETERNREIVKKVQGYLREAIFELRKLSHQLAPVFELDQDFKHKVIELGKQVGVLAKIDFHFDIDPLTDPVAPGIQLALYRIIQEQFSNIAKHAKCKNAYITIKTVQRKIVLSIADDGVGFDLSKKPKGIGFANIKRRVNSLNGRVKVISSPANGCELFVQINT